MADTKVSALPATTLPFDGTEVFPVVRASTSEKITSLQMGLQTVKALSGDVTTGSTTPSKVTGLDTDTGTGTFIFRYYILHRSAATTTGIKFDVNHSGTVTAFVWNQRFVDVSATAATAAQDQDAVLSTAGVMAAFASRAKGTAGRGKTLSVDTANADMLTIIEGLFICTVSGDLQLYHGSEVAANSTVKTGTSLILTRTA